jgi:hypothetical protein
MVVFQPEEEVVVEVPITKWRHQVHLLADVESVQLHRPTKDHA